MKDQLLEYVKMHGWHITIAYAMDKFWVDVPLTKAVNESDIEFLQDPCRDGGIVFTLVYIWGNPQSFTLAFEIK